MSTEELKCPEPVPQVGEPIPGGEEEKTMSQSIIVMMALLGINSVALSYLRKARSNYPFVTKYIQDATVTTLIGIFAGTYLKISGENELLTTLGNGYQEFFMLILLPPILFESAINMHKRSFFRNIGTILMYALLGTLIGACITAVGIFIFGALGIIHKFTFGECFAFGSLISSTDPVTVLAIFKEMNADKNLYSVIFGESILNDAISIALYKTITIITRTNYDGSWFSPVTNFLFLFLGSVGLGFLIGLFCSIMVKTYFGNPQPGQETTEVTLMILIPWIAYLIGEAFNLSGIVTILFCGIAMTKYALPNLSKTGRVLTKKLYQALSSSAEHLVFIFIGIGFFSFKHHWEQLKWAIFFITFCIITSARFGQITIVTMIVNKFRPRNKITRDYNMVLTYAGFRGAMAFALAANAASVFTTDDAGSLMLTLTLVYATLTIFIFGSTLVPLLQYYGVQEGHEKGNKASQLSTDTSLIIETTPKSSCWEKSKYFCQSVDDLLTKFIVRPTRGGQQAGSGSSFGRSQEIPETPSEHIPETPADTPLSKLDASLHDDLASANTAMKVNRLDSD